MTVGFLSILWYACFQIDQWVNGLKGEDYYEDESFKLYF